ncbi:MAG: hypothetical protein HQK55_18285, partial [Deltaproteobacteria bacterium]|nr:hypothetical protein [Deltaproteobacteria bacterium]
AAASKEQAQGIEQSNRAMSEVEKVTQQNASTAEESASASEELNAQAVQMKNYVAELITLVGGNGRAPEMNQRRVESPITARLLKDDHEQGKAAVTARRPGGGNGDAKVKPIKMIKGGVGSEIRPEQVVPLEYAEFRNF